MQAYPIGSTGCYLHGVGWFPISPRIQHLGLASVAEPACPLGSEVGAGLSAPIATADQVGGVYTVVNSLEWDGPVSAIVEAQVPGKRCCFALVHGGRVLKLVRGRVTEIDRGWPGGSCPECSESFLEVRGFRLGYSPPNRPRDPPAASPSSPLLSSGWVDPEPIEVTDSSQDEAERAASPERAREPAGSH